MLFYWLCGSFYNFRITLLRLSDLVIFLNRLFLFLSFFHLLAALKLLLNLKLSCLFAGILLSLELQPLNLSLCLCNISLGAFPRLTSKLLMSCLHICLNIVNFSEQIVHR